MTKKILIVKTSSLGDILQSYAALAYLGKHYPKAQIDWVVEVAGKDLIYTHPYINTTHIIDTKKWRRAPFSISTWRAVRSFITSLQTTTYDIVIDLQGNTKSALITKLAKGKKKVGFGSKTVPEWTNLFVTGTHIDPPEGKNRREDYLYIVRELDNEHISSALPKGVKLNLAECEHSYLKEYLKKPTTICIAPGSAWKNKKMPIDSLSQLLNSVGKELDAHLLILFGNDTEKKEAEQLSKQLNCSHEIVQKMPLAHLQRLMSLCHLVISNDSLPLHLAGASDTPTFGLFGPSSAVKYNPLGPVHGYYQGTCPYDIRFNNRCPYLRTCKKAPCMHNIDPHKLFHHFMQWYHSLPNSETHQV